MRILATLFAFAFSMMIQAQSKNDQLFEAVQKNEKDKAEMLLKAGCDPNYVKIGSPYIEITPLIAAVQNKNLDMASLLIEHKANLNWKDNLKSSALIYAVNEDHLEMIKLLVDKGANVNDTDANGKTVKQLAKEKKNKGLISYLENK